MIPTMLPHAPPPLAALSFHDAPAAAALLAARALAQGAQQVDCDVIVAGGSLSAAAAAVAAANASRLSRVCLLEPTEWAGP